jgi:hypothetical protein
MNLLVKKIGLVLLPALFFACEDPTDLGANLNPNTGALSVHYAEFPLATSQVRSDSIFTSLRQLPGGTNFYSPYVGRVQSEQFGTLTASLYANLALPAQLPAVGTYARLDSVKLDVVWNKNVYGSSLIATQHFTVHQLTAPIPVSKQEVVNDSVNVYSYNYYSGNTREVGPQIGQFTFSIADVASRLDADTTLPNPINRRISIPIDKQLGEQLLSAFRTNEGNIRDSQQAFENFFKGIAIVPSQQNTFLTSLDLISENEAANLRPGLTLYYTQGTEQRTIRLRFRPPNTPTNFYLSSPAYFALESDFSGTPLASAATSSHLQTFNAQDGQVYFQGITGIYPKVDLTPFKDFVVSMQDEGIFVLNRAVVEIDSVVAGTPGRQPLPQSIEFYFVDDNNRRFQAAFSQAGAYERASSIFNRSYTVGETTVNYYQADIAFNLEQFLRTGEDRYLQAIIYPVDPLFSAPNRFVVQNKQVKLKLWYTKIKESTN